MRKILLCILVFGLSFFDKKDAFSKESKFYVRTNAYIGYNYSVLNDYINVDYFNAKTMVDGEFKKYERRHLPIIGIGSNLYFKFNNIIHPFIGFDLTGIIPLGERTEMTKNLIIESKNIKKNYNTSFSFERYLKLNAKLGVKFNFNNSFAIEPYALAGIEVVRAKLNYNYYFNDKLETGTADSKLLAIYGLGINFVFKDRYNIGVDYYSYNNVTKNVETKGDGFIRYKISMYNILVKFGIQF